MNMMELYNALRPLKLRMLINRAIDCLLLGLCIGAGIASAIAVSALLMPVTFIINKIILSMMIVFLLSIIASLFMVPSYKAVAQQGDKLGLKERLTTALELKDQDSPIARIQRFDAIKTARSTDFSKLYPLKIDCKKILIISGLMIVTIIASIMPTQNREIAKQQEKIKREISKQAEQIKKEQKKVASNRELTLEEVKELNSQLKELEKNLRKSKDESEAIKALARTQHKLDEIKEKTLNKDLTQLGEKLAQLAQNPAMQQALQQLASALQQSRANISGTTGGQLQNPTLVSRLSQSSQNGSSGNQTGSGNRQQGSNSNGQGNGSQPGSGSGNGSGQGNNGNGNGTGGGGAGSGTGNGSDSSGRNNSGSNSQGKAPGEKKVRDYEQIFASKRLGGDGEVSNVNGTHSDSGTVEQVQVDNVPTLRGESLPYNEVYEQYKYEAMNSMQRSSIPAGMKTLIEEYFSSLE